MKSVFVVFPVYQSSFGYRSFRVLLEGLLRAGLRVHCITGGELNLEPHPELQIHPLEFSGRVKRSLFFPIIFSVAVISRIIKIARKESIQGVVINQASYAAAFAPLRLLLGKPVIAVLEVTPWVWRKSKSRSALRRSVGGLVDRLGLFLASRIFVPSEALKGEMIAQHPYLSRKIGVCERKVIFPFELDRSEDGKVTMDSWRAWLNGQIARRKDFAEEFQLPEKWIYLATPTELLNRRNIELALRALSVQESTKLALVFCGQSPHRNYLEALVVGLGLQEQVVFADTSIQVVEVISACDVLLMPSTYSGNSQFVAQALGSGTAVLLSDSPENLNFMTDENVVFDSENVQALAGRLERLATNKHELESLRRVVREYSPKLTDKWCVPIVDSL